LYVFAFVGFILLAAIVYLNYIQKKSIPDYNQSIKLLGLDAEVEVLRDEFGIPHIYAKNEKDLYTAVGYIMAQDRLWQMDLLRRVTTGRLSEMFGDKTVKTDQLMRALQMTKKSQMVLDSLPPQIRQTLDYFADGVNQYLTQNEGNLPVEFTLLGYKPEKWEAIHTANLIGYMAWDLTSGWKNEFILKQLFDKVGEKASVFIPDLNQHKSYIFPDFVLDSTLARQSIDGLDQTAMLEQLGTSIFFGSNNWAVAPKKSATGGPIMANDMHLGIFTPGIWYQMHLVIEGQLNVTGLGIPGAPYVVAGHNERIAWGMTNVMLDETDFYQETVNPENENQYKLDGKWVDFSLVNEEIKIKDAESQNITLRFTHRGPVVSSFKDIDKEVISMHWLGNDYSNEIRSLYLLNRAKNWTDFREAVKTFIAVSQNIVYSDVDGNIGLQTCAGIAIREGSGIEIYPGETSLYDWKGLVPFEKLPFSYNPACGYVASANNRTVGDDYPFYISYWFFPSHRYDRIVEMIKAKDKLSVDDFKAMLADQKSMMVRKYRPEIVSAIQKIGSLTKNQQIAFDSLKNWNDIMYKDGISPAIFEMFIIKLVENTVSDEIGEQLTKSLIGSKNMTYSFLDNIWKTKSAWFDKVNTKDKQENFENIVQESFVEAITQMENDFGQNPKNWLWGDIHQITLNHPMGSVKILNFLFDLNRGPYRVGGAAHTVSPYSYPMETADFMQTNNGASHRHIFLPMNWDASQTIIPSGTSGIPASDFYCNQTQMYINNEYHHDYISRNKVEESAVYRMKFEK
jgi:penicillin amidase